jgi:TniQ
MILGEFLPVAPRPFEDELLSSWQGRIACRYDLCADGLSERLGVAPHDRSIGFSGRDFAPAPAAVSAWARACRLSEGRVREMALSTRPRPMGLYVWGEGRAVGAIRRPLCPACLEEDADAGRDHHIRRTWALVESCLCDRHGRFLSETCAHCHSALGFRFRNRGGARLVCIRCQSAVRGLPAAGDAASPAIQGFFGRLSPLFAGSIECPPSTACAVLRAARLLWASPRARGRSRTPFIARIASDAPSPPLTGAAEDRREPLATASLGWRMATLVGVAQLLDLGGARRDLGSAPFTVEQLAEWTGEVRSEFRWPPARPVAGGPAVLRAPLRAPRNISGSRRPFWPARSGETRAQAPPLRDGVRSGGW